ncbi:hypothetical protein FA13DRAFT_1619354 [Coprinellus micaceus]|uniref:F-box domain-containing protein n=1 Tax=Coprinellus micaceus TaxID=71717 RepID=A0A4Y7TZI4_COPMI|nr:hypothetical protein FA13DRAFT_1619354 [Coprinellus micaceus]
MGGSACVEPEDSFSSPHQEEGLPETDPGIFEDRRTLARVCSTFRALVTEICVEYIVVQHGDELEQVVRLLEHSKPNAAGKRLGETTLRVDLKIIGPYNPALITTLLMHTPNLMVFANHSGRSTGVLGRMPKELVHALATHGRHIRRLEFDSINEAPTLLDIIDIAQPSLALRALSLRCIHSYPNDPDVIQNLPIIPFTTLKTLLLNRIPIIPGPEGRGPPSYPSTWTPFLMYLRVDKSQLPQLERLEVSRNRDDAQMVEFFRIHGWKFRMLKVSTESVKSVLPQVLRHCSNLDSLVLAHRSRIRLNLPHEMPGIRRICITPYVEETARVPPHIFYKTVLFPLGELMTALDRVRYGSLSEVRVRNVGVYDELAECDEWSHPWWSSFNQRGIRFVDKEGRPYADTVHRESPSLIISYLT